MLFDVGAQASMKDTLAIVGGITTASEVEGGASENQPHLFGYPFQGFEALREQPHIRFVDGSHGDRRYDGAMVVRDRDDLLACLLPGGPTALKL
jgi:hypothetical protein